MGEKIVIVVGAGASAEFGLPVGSKLVSEVSNSGRKVYSLGDAYKSNGDPTLFSAAQLIGSETNSVNFLEELKKISSGVLLMPSIDNYLHTHSDKRLRIQLGKLLIADALIKAEKASSI